MPRITSSKTYAEFKHNRQAADSTHVQTLSIEGTVSGGTFRLRVNGYLTAAIAWHAVDATVVSNINTALDLITPSAGDLVATGATVEAMTLTGNAVGHWRVAIDKDADLLTGNTTTDPNITTEVTTIGGTWIQLHSDMSEFNYEETSETTDVTGLSELAQEVLVVKSNASFSLSLYEANQSWSPIIYSGIEGRLRIFNEGKVIDKKYLEMECLLESVSGNTPDHDVLEKEISGMRQGAWIAPPDSYWKGS